MIINNSESNHETWITCPVCGHIFDAREWLGFIYPNCGYNTNKDEHYTTLQRNTRT
jgi:uncharacterized C2H2 Zn-finger protein